MTKSFVFARCTKREGEVDTRVWLWDQARYYAMVGHGHQRPSSGGGESGTHMHGRAGERGNGQCE